MRTVRPACRKSPSRKAAYSGASPISGTAATVIEDPGPRPAAEEAPGTWQPARSMTAAVAPPAAIRMRPRLRRCTGQPAGTTLIRLLGIPDRADRKKPEHAVVRERTVPVARGRGNARMREPLPRDVGITGGRPVRGWGVRP